MKRSTGTFIQKILAIIMIIIVGSKISPLIDLYDAGKTIQITKDNVLHVILVPMLLLIISCYFLLRKEETETSEDKCPEHQMD